MKLWQESVSRITSSFSLFPSVRKIRVHPVHPWLKGLFSPISPLRPIGPISVRSVASCKIRVYPVHPWLKSVVPFDRATFTAATKALADKKVFVGTSSWKYDGWCGQIYDRARYEYRGNFAQSRFNKACLAEYAKVFKTVCVDAAYYRFPDRQYLEGMVSQCRRTSALPSRRRMRSH